MFLIFDFPYSDGSSEDGDDTSGFPDASRRQRVASLIKFIQKHIPQLFATPASSAARDVLQSTPSLCVNIKYDVSESWLRPPSPSGIQ